MKLTKERIDILAAALRKGVIIKHACIGAGICEKTYHNWQNEASDNELDPLDPEESLGKNPNRDDVLRYFVRETSRALNDYSSGLLEKIHQCKLMASRGVDLGKTLPGGIRAPRRSPARRCRRRRCTRKPRRQSKRSRRQGNQRITRVIRTIPADPQTGPLKS